MNSVIWFTGLGVLQRVMWSHMQIFLGKCFASAALRSASLESFTLCRTVRCPGALEGPDFYPCWGWVGLSWRKTRHPKTTLIFQSSACVFSLFQECYNIIRDFQRMLLTNFSFKHELLSWVFISFAFFPLFLLKLMQLWISTVLEKHKAATAMSYWRVAPFVCCFTTASLKMPLQYICRP